jgi:hypothetical protein
MGDDVSDKKKPSLSMVVGIGKPTEDKESPEEDAGEYDASVDELADVLDVPDAKRDAFRDALQAAIMSCR